MWVFRLSDLGMSLSKNSPGDLCQDSTVTDSPGLGYFLVLAADVQSLPSDHQPYIGSLNQFTQFPMFGPLLRLA